MSELRIGRRRSALEGAYETEVFPKIGAIRVTVELRADIHLVNLRGEPQAPSTGDALPLPTVPNTSAGVHGGDLLWLGPGEWLLSTAEPAPDLLALWHGESTDVSHGRCVLRIGGDATQELLATGISLDLHSRAFAPGACAQTLFGGVNVLLHRLRGIECIDFYVPRSYARHAWELLRAAASNLQLESGR